MHLQLIIVYLLISVINFFLIPLLEKLWGILTCTVQYPGTYFTVTLIELMAKKKVTELYDILYSSR